MPCDAWLGETLGATLELGFTELPTVSPSDCWLFAESEVDERMLERLEGERLIPEPDGDNELLDMERPRSVLGSVKGIEIEVGRGHPHVLCWQAISQRSSNGMECVFRMYFKVWALP